jgi:hypothetical protein
MLQLLTKMRPSTIQSLQRIEGFPGEKFELIGSLLVDKIVNFCRLMKFNMDLFDEPEKLHSIKRPGSTHDIKEAHDSKRRQF